MKFKLPATPGMARRLLRYNDVRRVVFDEQLVELAMRDILTLDQIPSWLVVNDTELELLQFVQDWDHRAMIITTQTPRARLLALAGTQINSRGQTIIMSNLNNFTNWVEAIQAMDTNQTISVFGNPRYTLKKPLPMGLEYTDRPDLSADFLISNFSGLLHNDVVGKIQAGQSIVEEVAEPCSVAGRFHEAVGSLKLEIPRPVTLLDIKHFYNWSGQTRITPKGLLANQSTSFTNQLGELITWVWPHDQFVANAIYATPSAKDSMMREGLMTLRRPEMLANLAVSTHMLDLTGSDNSAKPG
jgi:hypothetical protein